MKPAANPRRFKLCMSVCGPSRKIRIASRDNDGRGRDISAKADRRTATLRIDMPESGCPRTLSAQQPGRECREHRSVGRHEEVATECHLQVQLVERGKELPNALAHVGHRERRAKPAHPAQAIGGEPVVAADRKLAALS